MRRAFNFVFPVLMVLLLTVTADTSIAGSSRRSEGSLRCSGRIVSRGDTKYEVLSKCGEPTWSEFYQEERLARDFYNPYVFDGRRQSRVPRFVREIVFVEEWIYNFGSTKFLRYLTFENGRLVDIEIGEYGY